MVARIPSFIPGDREPLSHYLQLTRDYNKREDSFNVFFFSFKVIGTHSKGPFLKYVCKCEGGRDKM